MNNSPNCVIVSSIFIINSCNMNEISTACGLQMLLTGRETQISNDVIILFVMIINPHARKFGAVVCDKFSDIYFNHHSKSYLTVRHWKTGTL
jgi:hypothetical protein